MRYSFRLLVDGPCSGFWNMAVDEALLQSVMEGNAPPTVRLYRWKNPCLSLGYFQKSSDIDLVACRAQAVDCVRRITGGRAVLHDRELTYSVIMPVPAGSSGTVPETCRAINQGVAEGLRALGIRADFCRRPHGERVHHSSPVCFESPSQYELLVEGKKIVGSAQTRRRGTLLQHGSLPLDVDSRKMASLFRTMPEGRSDMKGLSGYLPSTVDDEIILAEIVKGFQRTFPVSPEESSLLESEYSGACVLEKSKYRSEEWNFRR